MLNECIIISGWYVFPQVLFDLMIRVIVGQHHLQKNWKPFSFYSLFIGPFSVIGRGVKNLSLWKCLSYLGPVLSKESGWDAMVWNYESLLLCYTLGSVQKTSRFYFVMKMRGENLECHESVLVSWFHDVVVVYTFQKQVHTFTL